MCRNVPAEGVFCQQDNSEIKKSQRIVILDALGPDKAFMVQGFVISARNACLGYYQALDNLLYRS